MKEVQQNIPSCFALFQREYGYVPNLFLAQQSAPQLVEGQAKLITNILFNTGELSRIQQETIALFYAACRQNAYCATLHYRNLLVLGISRDKLDRLLQHRPGKADQRSTALLDLAAALAIDRAVALRYAAYACVHWTPKAVRESILSCALSAFLCELSTRICYAPDFPLLNLYGCGQVEAVDGSAEAFDPAPMNDAMSRVVPLIFKELQDKPEKSAIELANEAAFKEFVATAQIAHPDPTVSRQSQKELEDPDRDLVGSAQQGNLSAFSQLVDRHGRRVYRTLIGFLEDRDEALDAMQDTFLKAFQCLPTFEGRSKFSTWLLTIATNVGIQRLREKRPHERLDEDPEDIERFRPKQLRAWTDNPEEWYSKQERRQLVEEAVRKLPPKYRIVLLMRDIEELSTDDAATALQLSVPALKARLVRGRLMLRESLSIHFGRERAEVMS